MDMIEFRQRQQAWRRYFDHRGRLLDEDAVPYRIVPDHDNPGRRFVHDFRQPYGQRTPVHRYSMSYDECMDLIVELMDSNAGN